MIRIIIADPDSATRKALTLLLRRKLGTDGIIEVEGSGRSIHLQRRVSGRIDCNSYTSFA